MRGRDTGALQEPKDLILVRNVLGGREAVVVPDESSKRDFLSTVVSELNIEYIRTRSQAAGQPSRAKQSPTWGKSPDERC
jgi:hypothetical protein